MYHITTVNPASSPINTRMGVSTTASMVVTSLAGGRSMGSVETPSGMVQFLQADAYKTALWWIIEALPVPYTTVRTGTVLRFGHRRLIFINMHEMARG